MTGKKQKQKQWTQAAYIANLYAMENKMKLSYCKLSLKTV